MLGVSVFNNCGLLWGGGGASPTCSIFIIGRGWMIKRLCRDYLGNFIA